MYVEAQVLLYARGKPDWPKCVRNAYIIQVMEPYGLLDLMYLPVIPS